MASSLRILLASVSASALVAIAPSARAQDAAPGTPAPTPAPQGQPGAPVRITPPITYSLPSGSGEQQRANPPVVVTPAPTPAPTQVRPALSVPLIQPIPAPDAPAPKAQAPRATPSSETSPPPSRDVAPPAERADDTPPPTEDEAVEAPPSVISPEVPVAAPTASPASTGAVAPQPEEEGSGWPWLVGLALLLAAAGGVGWFRSRRAAAAHDVEPAEAEPADPAVPAATPVAPTQPTPPVDSVPADHGGAQAAPSMLPPTRPAGGTVTATLPAQPGAPMAAPRGAMPPVTLTVIPHRAGMTADEGVIDFSIVVANHGRERAENMLMSAFLLTAHGEQDDEIAARLAAPSDPRSHNPFALAPGESRRFDAGLTIPRTMIHPIASGTTKVFVPILVAGLRYRSGLTTGKRASAAFMIGRKKAGQERLAPLPLDGDSRLFTDLGARVYQPAPRDLRMAS